MRFPILPACVLVGLLMQGACLASGANGAGKTQGVQHAGCELTMQSNTFAGLCGELVLRNSGSLTMQGWMVNFDLPQSGRLVQAWNANFTSNGTHVTVQPTAAEQQLSPGQTVSLGYCSSGAASNVDLTAGLCGNVQPTPNIPPTPPVDPNAQAMSANGSVEDDFARLDPNAWNVVDDANSAACAFTASSVNAGDQGLALAVGPAAGGQTTCGEVRSLDLFSFGHYQARLMAAQGSHVVTRFGIAGESAAGLQQLSIDLSSDEPTKAYLTTWRDGTRVSTTVDLGFDAGAASHAYGIWWSADSIAWAVDGNVVYSATTNMPHLGSGSITLGAWVGTPDAGVSGSFVGTAQVHAICAGVSFIAD